MNEQDEDREQEPLPEAEPAPPCTMPMLRCYGEGYITRKNGEVVPFTIQGEG